MQTSSVVRQPQAPVSHAGLTHSQISQLITLAAIRNLELCQSIRMARMQLPGDSPGILSLVRERELNAEALTNLQILRASLS